MHVIRINKIGVKATERADKSAPTTILLIVLKAMIVDARGKSVPTTSCLFCQNALLSMPAFQL